MRLDLKGQYEWHWRCRSGRSKNRGGILPRTNLGEKTHLVPVLFPFFSLHIKIIYKVGAIGHRNGQFRLDKGWSEQQQSVKFLWKKIIGCQTGFCTNFDAKTSLIPNLCLLHLCSHEGVETNKPKWSLSFLQVFAVFSTFFFPNAMQVDTKPLWEAFLSVNEVAMNCSSFFQTVNQEAFFKKFQAI